MAKFASTASASTPAQMAGSGIITQQHFESLINGTYDELDEAFKADLDASPLMMLFREVTQKFESVTVQGKLYPGGTTPLNRDTEDLPMMTAGEGFSHSYQTYNYRLSVQHERTLEEVDDAGVISERAEWLMDTSRRTLINAMADVLNRGVNPTNAPFLCADGMYLIDTARPNPDPRAGTWSNQETIGDITEDLLFTAALNVSKMRGPNGDRMHKQIVKLIINPDYEQVLWKELNTALEVGTSQNTANWAKARFEYEKIQEFTDNAIYYLLGDPKSKKNGLQIRWRVKPGLADTNPENPDVFGKRIRFAFGVGCYDPREMWRGGELNSL